MKKRSSDVKGIAIVALFDFLAVTLASLIAVLAVRKPLYWDLGILWWYLANVGVSFVFLILFRLYYFMFDTVEIGRAHV